MSANSSSSDYVRGDEQYFHQRTEEMQKREKGTSLITYPHKFTTTDTVHDFKAMYATIEAGQRADKEHRLAGRVTRWRPSGSKLIFADLRNDGYTVQLWINAKEYEGDFNDISTTISRGDIVGVVGVGGRTKRGELSVMVREMELLSPCLRPLPGVQSGLTDKETRYRNRHLDGIVNHDEVRRIFNMRSEIIKFIRRFFDKRGFMEVETPMLNSIVGGAAARPFASYMHSLQQDVYMRVSPELYLKQLIVAGFEKVYEIGRQFRNEGLDLTHNPEFTSIETYEAYQDYHDLMKMTEELLSSLVEELTGSCKVKMVPFSGEKKEEVEVDFTPPFRRVPMISELERILEVTMPRPLDSDECNEFLRDLCAEHEVECAKPHTTTRLLDSLVGEYIEPHCINPTFIIDHPQVMSPLAKYHRDDNELTERFELFINGKEICNAYTELNNPHVQRKCFADQLKDREAGDDEAQLIDHTFINALDHGLPPTAGWGMGIDRLCMMLTRQNNIKEVLFFPMMRPLPK